MARCLESPCLSERREETLCGQHLRKWLREVGIANWKGRADDVRMLITPGNHMCDSPNCSISGSVYTHAGYYVSFIRP